MQAAAATSVTLLGGLIPGALDIVSGIAFLTAAGIAVYTLAFHRRRRLVLPAVCALAGALVMAWVALGNALNGMGISATLHNSEEFGEIVFPSLLLYLMYAMYAYSRAEEVDRQRGTVQQLDRRLGESIQEIGGHRVAMLEALSAAVDARDHYTALHSIHVADYSAAVGYRLGMRTQLVLFEQAGLLHDIGKIGVSDALLLKPSRLTPDEYEAIKKHVEESASIIGTVPFLSDVVPTVRHHHERWDGTGYPDGLTGEEIPRPARVLAVADAFDAMTTDRPYRTAMSVAEATRHLIEGRGRQFDPDAVDALVGLLDEGVIVVGANV